MSVLSRLLSRPEAKEIVGELVRNIKKKNDPNIFASLYLEIMRDPKNDDLRRDACALLMFSGSRSWDEMLKELKPTVNKANLKILKSPTANLFYVNWKKMVMFQVKRYWRSYFRRIRESP